MPELVHVVGITSLTAAAVVGLGIWGYASSLPTSGKFVGLCGTAMCTAQVTKVIDMADFVELPAIRSKVELQGSRCFFTSILRQTSEDTYRGRINEISLGATTSTMVIQWIDDNSFFARSDYDRCKNSNDGSIAATLAENRRADQFVYYREGHEPPRPPVTKVP